MHFKLIPKLLKQLFHFKWDHFHLLSLIFLSMYIFPEWRRKSTVNINRKVQTTENSSRIAEFSRKCSSILKGSYLDSDLDLG